MMIYNMTVTLTDYLTISDIILNYFTQRFWNINFRNTILHVIFATIQQSKNSGPATSCYREKTATLPNPGTRSIPSVGVIVTIVLPLDFACEIHRCRLQSYRWKRSTGTRDRGKRKNGKNCEAAVAPSGKSCGIDSTIPLILICFEGARRDGPLYSRLARD